MARFRLCIEFLSTHMAEAIPLILRDPDNGRVDKQTPFLNHRFVSNHFLRLLNSICELIQRASSSRRKRKRELKVKNKLV